MRFLDLDVEEYRLRYKVGLRNKISFLIGDSATGKSRLVDFISRYNRNNELGIGVNEDIKISSDFENIFVIENKASLIEFTRLNNVLIIVDEMYMSIVLSNLEVVKKSSSFFLFIFRDMISNITTGIYDILKLSSVIDNGITINYSESLYCLQEYSIKPKITLVEDSGSGYKFYSSVLSTKCLSAKGKTRVIKGIIKLLEKVEGDLLIIVDEVGFGYEFSKFMSYDVEKFNRVYFWCPLSFEYILLNSGMFLDLPDVFEKCDWGRYSTVEKFIEHELKTKLKPRGVNYSKSVDVTNVFQGYVESIFNRNFDNYENILRR